MTEKMFQEAKKDFENRLRTDFDYLNRSNREVLGKSIIDLLAKAFEDAIRNNVPVGNFPMWPVHDADGGYDEPSNEELGRLMEFGKERKNAATK